MSRLNRWIPVALNVARDSPLGECMDECHAKDLCEDLFTDFVEVKILKLMYFLMPDLLHACKTHNIKALNGVCAVLGIT